MDPRLVLVFFGLAGSLHRVRNFCVRHAQHPANRAIGFLLVSIVSGTDGQLLLKTNNLAVWFEALGLNQLRHNHVAQPPLQLADRGMEVPVK
jgi:hypothetical protein